MTELYPSEILVLCALVFGMAVWIYLILVRP